MNMLWYRCIIKVFYYAVSSIYLSYDCNDRNHWPSCAMCRIDCRLRRCQFVRIFSTASTPIVQEPTPVFVVIFCPHGLDSKKKQPSEHQSATTITEPLRINGEFNERTNGLTDTLLSASLQTALFLTAFYARCFNPGSEKSEALPLWWVG